MAYKPEGVIHQYTELLGLLGPTMSKSCVSNLNALEKVRPELTAT